MSGVRSVFLVAAGFVLTPAPAIAKCYVDGEWYENDHPKCVEAFGEPPGSDEDKTDTGGSASAQPEPDPDPSPADPEPSGPSMNAGYVACLTWDLFDEWSTAHSNNDGRAMSYLLNNGCFRTQPSWKISIVERAFSTTKVRVYNDAGAVTMWTYMEAVNE